jgi:hypothetical protein
MALNADKDEPTRDTERKLRLLAMVTKSKIERELPHLANVRRLKADPISAHPSKLISLAATKLPTILMPLPKRVMDLIDSALPVDT